MPRPPRPDDLYRLRVATEPRLSPDGRHAVVALQTVAPGFDGYRARALASSRRDGSAPPRQLTLGAKHDHHPRFSPDGRTLAFISDRRSLVEEEPFRPKREPKDREDLQPGPPAAARRRRGAPADRPAARRRRASSGRPTGRGWSSSAPRTARPPPRTIAAAASIGRATPGTPPPSDYRFIDRLDYMLNGAGFTYDRVAHLWLVDVATGAATPADRRPGGRPRAGLVARRHADRLHVEPSPRRRHPRPRASTSTSWTSRAAPSPRSRAARVRCSRPRRGCRTAGRSPRSATGWRVARAAATTSGCSPPTAAMRRRPAAATCPPRTT